MFVSFMLWIVFCCLLLLHDHELWLDDQSQVTQEGSELRALHIEPTQWRWFI